MKKREKTVEKRKRRLSKSLLRTLYTFICRAGNDKQKKAKAEVQAKSVCKLLSKKNKITML